MTFGELTRLLLFEKENYQALYDGLGSLHDFYAEITGITAHDTIDHNISLPTGKAISPGQAAGCLLDIKRTTVFLRGIYKAILHLQKTVEGPVNILYAGCGPYASLLTPLTIVFSADEVRFYMMDVNKDSLDAVEKLYKHLGAANYISAFICKDASTYRLKDPVHLAVSEAMQPALRKEPQVSIMLNIIPQLAEGGVFIPQEITVSACLIDIDREMQVKLNEESEPIRLPLGTVYNIGMNNCKDPQPVVVSIPENFGTADELSLLTEIDVFEDDKLTMNDCSLTLPLKLRDVRGLEGRKIEFEYMVGAEPGFEYKIVEVSKQPAGADVA